MAFNLGNDEGGQAPNREELLRMAIQTASNNPDAARVMLREVLTADNRSERAMMWMAKLAQSKDERQEWLRRVLEVNPNNGAARDALDKMAYTHNARDNRVLLIFGVIAGVLIVLAIVIVIAAISTGG